MCKDTRSFVETSSLNDQRRYQHVCQDAHQQTRQKKMSIYLSRTVSDGDSEVKGAMSRLSSDGSGVQVHTQPNMDNGLLSTCAKSSQLSPSHPTP